MANRSFVRKAEFMSSLGSVYALFIPYRAGLAVDHVNGESTQHCHRDAARTAGNRGTGRWVRLRAARSECHFHRRRSYCCCSEARRFICAGSRSLHPLAGGDRCSNDIAPRSASSFRSLYRGTPEQPCVPVGARRLRTHRSLVHLSGLGPDAIASSDAKFLGRGRWQKALVAHTGKPNESYTGGQRPSSCFRQPTTAKCG